jgi:secreted Zn-dependent insulinase-like peptidase
LLQEPFNYVSRLGEQMQLYPPEHVIAGPYLLEQYDPELIESLLSLLTPSNMRHLSLPRSFFVITC